MKIQARYVPPPHQDLYFRKRNMSSITTATTTTSNLGAASAAACSSFLLRFLIIAHALTSMVVTVRAATPVRSHTIYGRIGELLADYGSDIDDEDNATNPPKVMFDYAFGGMMRYKAVGKRVEATSHYEGDKMVWEMYTASDADYASDRFYFKSVKGDCYLTHNSGKLKCVSTNTIGDLQKWDLSAVYIVSDYTSDEYNLNYMALKNVDTELCPNHSIQSYSDSELGMNSCNAQSALLQIHVLN